LGFREGRGKEVSEVLCYPSKIFFSEEDGGFIAIAPDLPGCSAFGDTAEAALRELQDAIQAWIGAAKKAGNPVPAPSREQVDELPSGRVLLRLPKTLHAQLIERANRDSTSLNTCLVMLLSQSLTEQRSSERMPDRVQVTDLLKSFEASVEEALHPRWYEHVHLVPRHLLDFSTPVACARVAGVNFAGKRLVQEGVAMNVRTSPTNEPVVYPDDKNG
jgi:predicted RNase H-like HicB family nuclease